MTVNASSGTPTSIDDLPPARDNSAVAVSSGLDPALPSTAQFELIALLEARVRAVVADNRLLRAHIRRLTVALDDSLDRESAHALCPHHERLVPLANCFPRPLAYRSVSSCNGLTQPSSAAARSEVC